MSISNITLLLSAGYDTVLPPRPISNSRIVNFTRALNDQMRGIPTIPEGETIESFDSAIQQLFIDINTERNIDDENLLFEINDFYAVFEYILVMNQIMDGDPLDKIEERHILTTRQANLHASLIPGYVTQSKRTRAVKFIPIRFDEVKLGDKIACNRLAHRIILFNDLQSGSFKSSEAFTVMGGIQRILPTSTDNYASFIRLADSEGGFYHGMGSLIVAKVISDEEISVPNQSETDMIILQGIGQNTYRHIINEKGGGDMISQYYTLNMKDDHILSVNVNTNTISSDLVHPTMEPIMMIRYITKISDLKPGDLIAIINSFTEDALPVNATHMTDINIVERYISYKRIESITDIPSDEKCIISYDGFERCTAGYDTRVIIAEFKVMGG